MGTDRRNPYVILGVPFGASEEEARSGFARARRRLRQDSDAPFNDEDLTWALHQVEQLIANPELAVDVYRVPADPGAAGNEPVGLFNPAPHALERHTEPNGVEWEAMRREGLAEAVRRVARPLFSERTLTIPYE